HDLVVAEHLRGGVADADLLPVMERLLHVDGHVLQRAHALERAPVRADHRSRLREGVEIAAHGDGGDAEAAHQLLDRDAGLLLDEVEDLPAALLHEQARLSGRGHWAAIITSLSFAILCFRLAVIWSRAET